MAVVAIDMGQKNDKYLVNVRNAEPKGLIGDAGVVRSFNDKDSAKNYIEQVNKTGVDTFVYSRENIEFQPPLQRYEGDTFEYSKR